MMSIDEVLGTMSAHLTAHPRLAEVASHWNGFEGWLKFELAAMLQARFGRPWIRNESGRWELGEVGVEHRFKRASERGDAERAKLIDLWLGNRPTMYFELKVAFANKNAGKQLQSWRDDFAKLGTVLEDEADVIGFASVLIAVGYDEGRWASALPTLQADPRLTPVIEISNRLPDEVGPIRFVALRQTGTARTT